MSEINELQGIWTQYGHERIAAWLAGGEALTITHAAVGNGGGMVPTVQPSQEALVFEEWRGQVNSVLVNPDDPTDVMVDVVLPNNVGGFWIREWGVFDDTGKLVAVGPHDEMHKPVITSGQAAEFLERFHLPVSNSAAINLTIATQALATQTFVQGEIGKHNADENAHDGMGAAFIAHIKETVANGVHGLDIGPDNTVLTSLNNGLLWRHAPLSVTEDLHLYVDPAEGDDSNDGLADADGRRLRTIQRALQIAGNYYYINAGTVINVMPGTHVQGTLTIGPTYTQPITITCDASRNTILPIAILNSRPGTLTISNATFSFDATTEAPSNACLHSVQGSIFTLHNCTVRLRGTVTASRIIFAHIRGMMNLSGATKITGVDAQVYTLLEANHLAYLSLSGSIAFQGTITASVSVVVSSYNGDVWMPASVLTLSGAVTGRRYLATVNSSINTGGAGANFIPGTVAGDADTARGGYYL